MPGPFIHSVEERTFAAATTVGPGFIGAIPKTKIRSNEGQTLLYSRLEKFDGSSRLVLANHGHGATSIQFGNNVASGLAAMALARTGRYIVLSIDGGLTTAEWGGPWNMDVCKEAVAWARANGIKAGKYAAMGWSMGGLCTLNWIRRDTNCMGAWLWVPAIDLDYFNSTSGYVPDYGVPLPNLGSWTSEISQSSSPYGAYNPRTTITASLTIPSSTTPVGQGVTVPVVEARHFNDCYAGRSNVAISGVVCTYASRDATHLYDVISAGVAFTPASGAIAAAAYNAANVAGFNPYAEFVDYSPAKFGATRKIALALSSDDTTIPPVMADSWLNKVNNPNIAPTAKSKTLGGHTNLFQYYADAEIVAFYDSLDWS